METRSEDYQERCKKDTVLLNFITIKGKELIVS